MKNTLKDLIEALTILLKYGNPTFPTYCANEELQVHGIDPRNISDQDVESLEELGFYVNIEGVNGMEDMIYSDRFGD